MLKHEAKLIDPSAEQIVAALTEVAAQANKRCRSRLLKDDLAKWRKFARRAAASPEGWEMVRGGKGGVPATQVLAAWWTDSIGRRHVVVRGRRVEHDEAKRLLRKEDLDKRPPLWHAYPEYVCRRTVGKQSQLVCACGCGAVGTPEALGWMGETCGPCADRKEELGEAGLAGNVPGVLYSDREPLGAVACSPDGARVAAVEGRNFATCWDLPRRIRTVVRFGGTTVTDVAITPDARYLLVAGAGLVENSGLFAAFDLSTDPPARIEPTLGPAPRSIRVAALPDPGRALVHTLPELYESHSRVEVIRVPSGEPVRGFDLGAGLLGRPTVSPDGRHFAAYGHVVRLFDLGAARPVRELPTTTSVADFSHDGTRLFVARGRVGAYDLATGKLVAEDRSGVPAAEGIRALAADPAGEFVYAGTWQGRVFALAADTLKVRAVLEWHLGGVSGLAVSADGSKLFSSGGDGCVKVWPIRDLLRGL